MQNKLTAKKHQRVIRMCEVIEKFAVPNMTADCAIILADCIHELITILPELDDVYIPGGQSWGFNLAKAAREMIAA